MKCKKCRLNGNRPLLYIQNEWKEQIYGHFCSLCSHHQIKWAWSCRHYGDVMIGAMVSSNHQPHECLLNHLFRRRSKKTSRLHVTGFCEGNSPVVCEFPPQRASNAENASIWWRHHEIQVLNTGYTNDKCCNTYSLGIIARGSHSISNLH